MPTSTACRSDPWEDGELVFVVVPDGFEAIDHAGEHVGHGFVGSRPRPSRRSGRCERDVAGVDGAGGLERGLNLGQRAAELHAAAEQFAVVWPVNVHLKPGLFRKHARLPVLVEVLRLNHADGLRLHGLKAEGDDVVHAFDNGAALHESGTPAGPNFTGISSPIAAEMVPHEEPFPVKALPNPAKVSRYDPSGRGGRACKHDHGPTGSPRRLRARRTRVRLRRREPRGRNRPPFPALLLTQQRCAVFGKSAEVCSSSPSVTKLAKPSGCPICKTSTPHPLCWRSIPSCMPCGPTTCSTMPGQRSPSRSTTARPSPASRTATVRSPRDGSRN